MKHIKRFSVIVTIAVIILFIYIFTGVDLFRSKKIPSIQGNQLSNADLTSMSSKTDLNQTIPVTDKWIIGCETDFPPYNFIDAQGKNNGLDTQLVSAVLNHLNIDFEIKTMPWKRVVYSVDNNYIDCGFQFVGKPERFEKYCMVGPLRNGITLFAVKKDSKIKDYTTLKDLVPYTIGHSLGYSYTPEFDTATFLKKDALRNNTLLINALVHNRINLMIGDLNTLSYMAKNAGQYGQIRFLPTILKEVPRYVAFPREKKEHAERFARGLAEIKQNGTYERIMAIWQ